jgi:NAD-dependent dihydropyrimidine dehydrogenase PreA subunit
MSGDRYMNIPRDKIPWEPTIDPEKCTNCGNCLDFCSNGVFEQIDGLLTVVKPLNCVVGCSACQKICPSGALRFPEMESFVETLRNLRNEYATPKG